MSFIKGSAEAMATQYGRLSLEDYLSLPVKRCPLEASKRAIIYKMYEKYEQLKKETTDYDQCDYVFHIIQQVLPFLILWRVLTLPSCLQLRSDRNLNLPKLDYIYVDEVQVNYMN
jgi:hypothetical protein